MAEAAEAPTNENAAVAAPIVEVDTNDADSSYGDDL
jgi:hypothetical protein